MTYYENFDIQSINKEVNRNYYIPYATYEEAFMASTRQESSRFTLLDGLWPFRYFESIREIPRSFFNNAQVELNDQIKVPSAWQYAGYDSHQYINVSYPIPYMPPLVPDDNPCGIYQREFEIDNMEMLHYLNFEGVDSNVQIWINQQFVGYDQITHSTKEFNITPYLKNGNNTLTVLVMKWCDGTYFEDQDKFRTSGIIRSVYLIQRPKKHVTNFRINTFVNSSNHSGEIHFDLLDNDAEIENYWLYDEMQQIIISQKVSDCQFKIHLNECHYWTAETPYLYTLIVKIGEEFIKQKVGVREIKRDKRIVMINDVPIKLFGVNHHDFDAVNGPSMTLKQMKKDMLMMKEANMNCIRTAHYPKAPEFYELADELGFYVVSEADIECHGIVHLFGDMAEYNLIGSDTAFLKPIMERVERSVIQNINFSSIFMWSMENESGYGTNFEAAQKKTFELDPTRLIHNERSIDPVVGQENDFTHLDVISQMYPSLATAIGYCEDDSLDKPYFMCEYAHAMGNGPGGFKEYFDLIQQYDSFLGGCVWEWADHVIDVDGHYLYGGDFGEVCHDGNFCVDGLTTPDRQITSKLIDYRNVHSPIQLVSYSMENEEVTLENIQRFSTSEKLKVILSWEINGKVVSEKVVDDIIQPNQTVTLKWLPPEDVRNSLLTLNMRVDDTVAKRLVAEQQLIIKDDLMTCEKGLISDNMSIKETDVQGVLSVETGALSFKLDVVKGSMTELKFREQTILEKETLIDIWRAPTDNDRNKKHEWLSAGYNRTCLKNKGYEIKDNHISAQYALVATGYQPILEFELNLHINHNQLDFQISANQVEGFPDLPRFGMTLPLKPDFTSVSYLGNGPYESYSDRKSAGALGVYSLDINHQERYVKPQEYGNHTDTKWLKISNGEMTLQINQPTNFSYRPFSKEQLTSKAHDFELIEEGNYLTIDYKQNGIGSNSCGPYVEEDYRFDEEKFDWQFQWMFKNNH
ncbi:MAG: glycoside hydrolase family 2 TIM barrel-domain containing protein [Vagococcus sp.]|uniref:glycoside hydrolase family 2 TIM barrel-domain containing protein n=1 Tax=Vagococcus TaxID=2737 RepID=UPI002FC9FF1E